jgi:hypothetical protein
MTLHATPRVKSTEKGLACKHCGEACGGDVVMYQDHPFCCAGCQMVYEILEQNDMCRYYEIDPKAGFSLRGRTYHHISFERDYRSYFPIASNRLENGVEHPVSLDKLRTGDMLVIRNEELVPADSILQKGLPRIDYSFAAKR